MVRVETSFAWADISIENGEHPIQRTKWNFREEDLWDWDKAG